MARRVQLVNNLFILLLILTGCDAPEVKKTALKMINADDTSLTSKNGIMYLADTPFSGTVFSLFAGTGDTAFVSSFIDGKEDGVWKKWFAPAKLSEIREFNKGKKSGIYKAFWENGNKKLLYQFVNDEYNGSCFEWNNNGMLTREMNYVNGHEEGLQKMFYDNGKVRSNYVMINGRRFGLLGTKNCINVSDSIFKK